MLNSEEIIILLLIATEKFGGIVTYLDKVTIDKLWNMSLLNSEDKKYYLTQRGEIMVENIIKATTI